MKMQIGLKWQRQLIPRLIPHFRDFLIRRRRRTMPLPINNATSSTLRIFSVLANDDAQ